MQIEEGAGAVLATMSPGLAAGRCGASLPRRRCARWAYGATSPPTSGDAPAMDGRCERRRKCCGAACANRWTAVHIPESGEADTGANFQATFETGTVGMQGSGGFAIAALKANHPESISASRPAGRERRRCLELRRR